MLHHVVWLVALMMKAGSISETSANFYQTTLRNIPEQSSSENPYIAFLASFVLLE
jgi:hypothetical protein